MADKKNVIYIDERGSAVFVEKGLGGGTWMSMRQSNSRGLHRVKSPALPIRDSRDAAQADLNAYAEKRGWRRREQ